MRDLMDRELEQVTGGLTEPHPGSDEQTLGDRLHLPPLDPPPGINTDILVCW